MLLTWEQTKLLSFDLVLACNIGYYKDDTTCTKCDTSGDTKTTLNAGATSDSDCGMIIFIKS